MNMDKWTSARALSCNVLGALLMLSGVALGAMNARNQISYRAIAGRHGGEVVDLGADSRPQAGQHGFMARVVGTPSVVEAPRDAEFNLRVDTPVLVRHVEMFQWREIRIGDSVHYELDWVDRPLDASRFESPAGHANPTSFPLQGQQFDAGLVQLGGFKLSPQLLHALPGSVVETPSPKTLPDNLAASFAVYEGQLVTSAHPGDPRLGDLRVRWEGVPLQQVTIVARIDGDRLVAAPGAADGKGYEVETGDVSLLNMFADLPVAPKFVDAWRLLTVLLAALGAFLLLPSRGHRRDPWLALACGALAAGVVIGVMWLGNDTGIACGWLTFALIGTAGAIWRMRRRPQAST